MGSLLPSGVWAQALNTTCGTLPITLHAAPPNSAVTRLSTAWAEAYETKCGVAATIQTVAEQQEDANLLCENREATFTATSRPVKLGTEAKTGDGWSYTCSGAIRAVQTEFREVAVAHEALVVVQSVDSPCILSSLSLDQLRWIFSSESEAVINPDLSVMPNSNGDERRTWRDIGGMACPDDLIQLAGPVGDAADFFANTVFVQEGETFRDAYQQSVTEQETLDLVGSTPTALGLVQFGSVTPNLRSIPLTLDDNEEAVVDETVTLQSIVDESYPLTRPIYMRVLEDDATLEAVNPFLAFGLSRAGQLLIRSQGLVPLSIADTMVMLTRLQAEGAVPKNAIDCYESSATTAAGNFIRIAGSGTLIPLAELWSKVYMVYCSSFTSIRVAAASDSMQGAERVCLDGNSNNPDSVDAGSMTRTLLPAEGTPVNGYQYACVNNPERSVVEIEMAMDAMVVVVQKGGRADACLTALGGLTVEELQWLYSDDDSLEADYSDGNATTKLWSELLDDPECQAVQVVLAGPNKFSGYYYSMSEILFGGDEGFDSRYSNSPSTLDILDLVEANEDAIGFVGLPAAASAANLMRVPIYNPDRRVYVKPDADTIEFGLYAPLSRKVYMYFDRDTLETTGPFISFCLSKAGGDLLETADYVHIPESEKIIMNTRAESPTGYSHQAIREAAGGCGPPGRTIHIAGSSTVFPIAKAWAGLFEVGCNTTVYVEGGGSSTGAARVCDASDDDDAVDIGNMSREWEDDEAVGEDGVYRCLEGGGSREVYQAQIAIDGVTVGTYSEGVAAECIELMGGLTVDQLRWIFSEYDEEELARNGDWDPAALPNSDGKPRTHFWSELDERCQLLEIRISGADELSGTYDYFHEVVFKGSEESFDLTRPLPYFNSEEDEVLVQYLQNQPAGISYFGYSYYFSRRNVLASVPIVNADGDPVRPTETSITDGTYNPFSRPIYMNILDDEESLETTLPFLRFGYSDIGTELVEFTGYAPVNDQIKAATLRLVEKSGGSDGDGLTIGIIVGIAVAGLLVVAAVGGALYVSKLRSKTTD